MTWSPLFRRNTGLPTLTLGSLGPLRQPPQMGMGAGRLVSTHPIWMEAAVSLCWSRRHFSVLSRTWICLSSLRSSLLHILVSLSEYESLPCWFIIFTISSSKALDLLVSICVWKISVSKLWCLVVYSSYLWCLWILDLSCLVQILNHHVRIYECQSEYIMWYMAWFYPEGCFLKISIMYYFYACDCLGLNSFLNKPSNLLPYHPVENMGDIGFTVMLYISE